jgi:intracellular sulfur oxidation DsrE/DsrF family protein
MRCCLMLLMFLPSLLLAQPVLELGTGVNQASSQSSHPKSNSSSAVLAVDSTPGYVARIDLNKPGQIAEALRRAEAYFQSKDYFDSLNSPAGPIAFVIFGPDVEMFFKQNYGMYKSTVDLAARLSSLGVIDIRVCQVSSKAIGLDRDDLLPFVSPVDFGPAELRRLLEEEDYSYF